MGNASCKIDHGKTKSSGFLFWSKCELVSCNDGYEEEDGKCVPVEKITLSGPCTLNPAVANALTYVYNSDSVCVVEKCEPGYILQDGKCGRPGPKDIPDLTGWYKDSISTDKKRWLDNSGNKNDWVIPATETAVFTLSDKTVSSDYKTLGGSFGKDGRNIATLKTSNLTPNAFTLFHVSRYVKDLASNMILNFDIEAGPTGTTKPSGYRGYHFNSGAYAGIRMCSTLLTEDADPYAQVGAACYEPGGESANYPPGEKPFMQLTSQHLVHRINSKNYPYVTRTSRSSAEEIALIKEPNKTQLKDVNSVIRLFAPFEMKELLIYNRKLTADEIDTVEKYLNDKYQIY